MKIMISYNCVLCNQIWLVKLKVKYWWLLISEGDYGFEFPASELFAYSAEMEILVPR